MKIWYWIIRIIRWLMSIFNCHKQEPQPWMSYISPSKICFSGGCCPVLITDVYSLLPFQIISEGDYIRSEISVYGSGVWTEITVPVTSVITDGFYIHTYNGETLSEELTCGAYEFRVIAGETWWFEPFTVEEFEFNENAYSVRDLLMAPLKFSEQLVDCGYIVAPCDSFLPFMYTTENASGGSPTYTLVSLDGTETALTITVDVLTIDGRTYYIHDGDCFYPFLECGRYYIRIDDGAYSYFSAWFDAVCEMNDIPDGYRAMRDANGCVMRDDEGEILTEACAEVPENISFGLLYNWYAATDIRNIAATGWSVPSAAQMLALRNYLDPINNDAITNVAGILMKEVGLTYWQTPNTGASNSSQFNGRGAGVRNYNTGVFGLLLGVNTIWNTRDNAADEGGCGTLSYNQDNFFNAINSATKKTYGASIRLIKDTTILSDGEAGICTGNDGKVYRTICIGTQEWLADNLAETKYRNGDDIPEITDNATWAALTTGAMCAYNNDWNNV